MRVRSYVLAVFLASSILAAQSKIDVHHAEQEIRAARAQSNAAIEQRNIGRFAETISSDFVMVRGSGIFVPSREAYLDLFRQDFADKTAVRYRRTPEKIEVSTAAPLAAEHGTWVGLNPDGTTAYRGTYLAMWRREGEKWLIRSELFVVLACERGEACKAYAREAK